jgi:hypothetical protein
MELERMLHFDINKSRREIENFENISSSSLIFAFSIHTAFSQTQIGVTFPLKVKSVLPILGQMSRYWQDLEFQGPH